MRSPIDNGHRRGERATARDADQRGIGERVAEQPLHDGTARRQQAADDGRDRDPRQSHRPEHELIAGERGRIAVAGRKPERGGQTCDRDTGGADRGRDDGNCKHDEQTAGR